MDPRSPSFEANLLYKTAPTPRFDKLVEEIADVLEAQGTMLIGVERVDHIFTLLNCDTVEILLAFTGDPLPVEHFIDANRPAAASLCEAEILGRLTRHKSSATVLVVDRDGCAGAYSQPHEELKRNLCWGIADCLHNHCAADLVFWCDSDTLYSADEFQRAWLIEAAPVELNICAEVLDDSPPTPRTMPRFTAEPQLGADAMAWFTDDLEEESRDLATDRPDRAALDMLLSVALPNRLALNLDGMVRSLDTHRMMNGAAMACASATIGLSSMTNFGPLFM